jgi:hypothetical protein
MGAAPPTRARLCSACYFHVRRLVQNSAPGLTTALDLLTRVLNKPGTAKDREAVCRWLFTHTGHQTLVWEEASRGNTARAKLVRRRRVRR